MLHKTAETRSRPRAIPLLTVIVIALIRTSDANANFTCSGKITCLGLSPEGNLAVSVNDFGVETRPPRDSLLPVCIEFGQRTGALGSR